MSFLTRTKNVMVIILLVASYTSICKAANDDLFVPIRDTSAEDAANLVKPYIHTPEQIESVLSAQEQQRQEISAYVEEQQRLQERRIQQQQLQAEQLEIARQQAEASLKLAEEKRIATQKAHEQEEKRIAEEERFHNMILVMGFVALLLIAGLAYIVITRNRGGHQTVTKSNSKFFADDTPSHKFNWLERLQTIIIPLRKMIGVVGCLLSSVLIILACLSAVSIFAATIGQANALFVLIVTFIEVYLKIWILFQLFKYSWKQFSNQSPIFSQRFNSITVPLLAGGAAGGVSAVSVMVLYAFGIANDFTPVFGVLFLALIIGAVFFMGCIFNNYFHKRLNNAVHQ